MTDTVGPTKYIYYLVLYRKSLLMPELGGGTDAERTLTIKEIMNK